MKRKKLQSLFEDGLDQNKLFAEDNEPLQSKDNKRLKGENEGKSEENEVFEFFKKQHKEMIYNGLINPSTKKITYKPSKLYNFSVRPNGFPTTRHWFSHVFDLIKEDPSILMTYPLKIESGDFFQILKENENATAPESSSMTFNQYQIKAYQDIKKMIEKKMFNCVCVIGPAGTGKTICLRQFVQNKDNFIYITMQNNLIQSSKISLGLKGSQTITLCLFFMQMLKLSFNQHCYLMQLVTSHTIVDYDWFFKNFPPNMDFINGFLRNGDNAKHVYLCIDEFSMIANNVIKLLTEYLKRIANVNFRIVVILCGDCHQIQPIHTNKSLEKIQDDPNSNDNRYLNKYITVNCQNILKNVDKKIFFFKQLRNDNREYINFLSRIILSETWKYEINEYFKKINCRNDKIIPFHYPVNEILNLSNFKDSLKDVIEWHTKTRNLFNDTRYFAWCNVDTHYINLSIFNSAYIAFKRFINDNPDNLSHIKSMRPRLALIHFTYNKQIYKGVYKNSRLPLLPLIIGMEYKFLITDSGKNFYRGELCTLVDIKETSLVLLTKGRLIELFPTKFNMNLFCQNKDNYEFEGINDLSGGDLRIKEKIQRCGMLFGFPIQMIFADTVRGSIGITVDSSMYINLNGCSLEETYVILSRTRDVEKIKYVYLK